MNSSGISGGGIVITDEAGQQGSTGQTGKQTIASLNRDVTTGTDTSGRIGNNFNKEEIEAGLAVTSAFVQQASKAVGDYVQGQRQSLREQLKNANTEAEKTAIQSQLSDLSMQERVMNVLIGAVSGVGGAALTKESLSAAAEQMRELMIEDSKKFPGVTDGTTTLSNLLPGKSEGVRGDGEGVGGARVDLDRVCGPTNERCAIQRNQDNTPVLDANGKTQLLLNSQGQVQFSAGSLEDFLQTDEGKKMAGATGGIQGWTGTLFGVPYTAGSWQDKLIEAFAGTHDMIGGSLSGLYDEQGSTTRGRSSAEKIVHEVWSGVALVPATPFAMAELLSPQMWQAISILLGGAK